MLPMKLLERADVYCLACHIGAGDGLIIGKYLVKEHPSFLVAYIIKYLHSLEYFGQKGLNGRSHDTEVWSSRQPNIVDPVSNLGG